MPQTIEALKKELDDQVDALLRDFHRQVTKLQGWTPAQAAELLWRLGLSEGKLQQSIADDLKDALTMFSAC